MDQADDPTQFAFAVPMMRIIVESVAKTIIRYVFKSDLSCLEISPHMTFSSDNSLLTVDLSQLEQVQKLLSPISGSAHCALDFVSFQAAHKKGGITIFTHFSDKTNHLKTMIEKHFSSFRDTVADKLAIK